MELAELTVRGFTEEIASASPAPGGGSAAALAGAVGAALTAMVSGLTLGRKKYEAVQELALRAQAQADALRKRLLAAMEQDTQAFLQVSAAYAMPKQTPEERQARSSAIEPGAASRSSVSIAASRTLSSGSSSNVSTGSRRLCISRIPTLAAATRLRGAESERIPPASGAPSRG